MNAAVKKLRWGILGPGTIAKAFAGGLAHSRTGQLVAIGFLLAGEAGDQILPVFSRVGLTLLWLSALLTLYTGWDYLRAGLRHVMEE